jgi:hypothetical protein
MAPGSVRVALLCLSYTIFVVIILFILSFIGDLAPNVIPNVFPDFPKWENIATKIPQNIPFSTFALSGRNRPEALCIQQIPAFSRGLDYYGK